jgi:hypothetical protein
MRQLGWAPMESDLCPYQRENLDTKTDTRDMYVEERPCKDTGRGHPYARQGQKLVLPCLILDFQPLEP